MTKLIFRLKGGEGSGDFGHQGRPGKVGGSEKGTGGIKYFAGSKPEKKVGPKVTGDIFSATGGHIEVNGKKYWVGKAPKGFNIIKPDGKEDTFYNNDPEALHNFLERDANKAPEKDTKTFTNIDQDKKTRERKAVLYARTRLRHLGNTAESWASRDTIMTLANDFLGGDYLSLGGEQGKKTAKKLATKLRNLPESSLIEMYEKYGGHTF